MRKTLPSVVVVGGGTGTFTVLNSLKPKPVHLTALMTMVDDGGSNRVLRDEFGLLPTSGIRQAMVALSPHQSLMRDLFMYRFHQGTGIAGMTFGNLFLAAMADIMGSQEAAIEATSGFLDIKGRIFPISYDNVRLLATYSDGSEVLGEHHIDQPSHDGTLRITSLRTVPKAAISPKALAALSDADMIVLGPGDFYSNTIANLIVEGVPRAIVDSHAKVVFVTNLMTKYGEAYNYRVSDYLNDLDRYLPLSRLNYVLINSDLNYPDPALKKYTAERSIPVEDDLNKQSPPSHIRIIRSPLLSSEIIKTQAGDSIRRSMIRHDTTQLGKVLMAVLND